MIYLIILFGMIVRIDEALAVSETLDSCFSVIWMQDEKGKKK